MTNKEAKEILEWELNNFKYTDNEFVEATKVAIKALEERRTGHWIKNAPPWDCQNPPFICSECGNPHLLFETPYCEICGADMRGWDIKNETYS